MNYFNIVGATEMRISILILVTLLIQLSSFTCTFGECQKPAAREVFDSLTANVYADAVHFQSA
jgi:hypothetical protein